MKARDVRCPWCEAGVGSPCVRLTIGGHRIEVTYFHQARAVLAAKLTAEKRQSTDRPNGSR